MSVEPPCARFDDHADPSRSFVLDDFERSFEAWEPSAVLDVLDAAERGAAAGGWAAGFVAYEAAAGIDDRLTVPAGTPRLPLAWFGLYRTRRAAEPLPIVDGGQQWSFRSTEDDHARAVSVIKDHIAAGDTYQTNLTVRATARVADPFALYALMARAQGGAYNAYLSTGTHAVLCASPELFFERHDDVLRTRPMKGTRRRGRWGPEDLAACRDLQASEKERAEHVMIVDLLRNDLGKVCEMGSVKVGELQAVEQYPTVWQMVSDISGRARPGTTLADVFTALFPCGSVTGAPKRRTMEIIADLEPHPRGVYCGAVGYLSPPSGPSGGPPSGPPGRPPGGPSGGPSSGIARFAVAIRSASVELATGDAEYGAGGGITWDSDQRAEWDEVLAKSSILGPSTAPNELLETFRFDVDDGPVNLELHLDRLASSARYFAIPFDPAVARRLVDVTCAGATSSRRVRLVLAASGDLRVALGDLPPDSSTRVRLGYAPQAVDSRDVYLFHKFADRARYDQAREARPDVDDVVLVNERGEVTQTTIANLVVDLGDGRWTPPVGCGLLPGVERTRLVRSGAVRERIITPAMLEQAASIVVVNSLRGSRAAVLVDRV